MTVAILATIAAAYLVLGWRGALAGCLLWVAFFGVAIASERH